MVNERQGKVYNPRPVYNRKLLRSVIRAGVQKQFGQHHVSANMAGNFEKIGILRSLSSSNLRVGDNYKRNKFGI